MPKLARYTIEYLTDQTEEDIDKDFHKAFKTLGGFTRIRKIDLELRDQSLLEQITVHMGGRGETLSRR